MADASSVTAFALTGIVPPVATMAYSDEDIARFYSVALDLVEKAGKVVVSAIENRDKKIAEKASPTDLVTETDKSVESLLVSGLK